MKIIEKKGKVKWETENKGQKSAQNYSYFLFLGMMYHNKCISSLPNIIITPLCLSPPVQFRPRYKLGKGQDGMEGWMERGSHYNFILLNLFVWNSQGWHKNRKIWRIEKNLNQERVYSFYVIGLVTLPMGNKNLPRTYIKPP